MLLEPYLQVVLSCFLSLFFILLELDVDHEINHQLLRRRLQRLENGCRIIKTQKSIVDLNLIVTKDTNNRTVRKLNLRIITAIVIGAIVVCEIVDCLQQTDLLGRLDCLRRLIVEHKTKQTLLLGLLLLHRRVLRNHRRQNKRSEILRIVVIRIVIVIGVSLVNDKSILNHNIQPIKCVKRLLRCLALNQIVELKIVLEFDDARLTCVSVF